MREENSDYLNGVANIVGEPFQVTGNNVLLYVSGDMGDGVGSQTVSTGRVYVERKNAAGDFVRYETYTYAVPDAHFFHINTGATLRIVVTDCIDVDIELVEE